MRFKLKLGKVTLVLSSKLVPEIRLTVSIGVGTLPGLLLHLMVVTRGANRLENMIGHGGSLIPLLIVR